MAGSSSALESSFLNDFLLFENNNKKLLGGKIVENQETQGNGVSQGEVVVNGNINSEMISNNLDDSIGLSQQKLRNAQVQELTLS